VRLAARFGWWDVDAFLSQLTVEQYLEWMAFDATEPLDAAGAILKGLSGSSKRAPGPHGGTPWQAQKQAMLQHIKLVQGRKG
jgi:hypothetical protein